MHIWIFSSWIILCQTTNPYNYCIYTIFHSCARISSTDQTNILIWFNNFNKYIWAISIPIKWPFKHGNRFTRRFISKSLPLRFNGYTYHYAKCYIHYSWYHRSTYVYKTVTSWLSAHLVLRHPLTRWVIIMQIQMKPNWKYKMSFK